MLRALCALGLLLLSVAGCAALTPAQRQAFIDHGLPATAMVDTPFFPQEQHQCGPAALATVLVWSGVHTSPEALTDEVYLPGREGSLQIEMVAATRRPPPRLADVRSASAPAPNASVDTPMSMVSPPQTMNRMPTRSSE